jgi:hypothetical protein
MVNVLQQFNWVMLMSQQTGTVSSSHRYRTAWWHLLGTLSSLQSNSSTNLDTKLDAALEKLWCRRNNYDPADLNSLREFVSAVATQSGNRIPRAEAKVLIGATQEIIELLMAR